MSISDTQAALAAWIPSTLKLAPADQHALDMTNPGLGLDGWHDVWFAVRGHFDDPVAADCRPVPDAGASSYFIQTPAAAVAYCRNQFVLDALSWLRLPPTDTASGPAPASPLPIDAGTVAVLAFLIALRLLGTRNRERAVGKRS
jgi:hypothetical protein